jgi:hypothetical protein
MLTFHTDSAMFAMLLKNHLAEHPNQANQVAIERQATRWCVTFADKDAAGPVLAMLSLYINRRERGALVGPEGIRLHSLKRTGRALERRVVGAPARGFRSRWFL